ncbi:hypothetical protein MK489_01580 [Myxococcota bacterium]|nr:hypothetical protein [Myxococcota bacterium]
MADEELPESDQDGPPGQESRGVQNPRVVDLIGLDQETDEVYLVMLEERPWGSESGDLQLRQLEHKFNSYLAYVLDGHLVEQYPQYAGKAVRFQLDCATSPGDAERPFLTAVSNFATGEDIRFVVNVMV